MNIYEYLCVFIYIYISVFIHMKFLGLEKWTSQLLSDLRTSNVNPSQRRPQNEASQIENASTVSRGKQTSRAVCIGLVRNDLQDVHIKTPLKVSIIRIEKYSYSVSYRKKAQLYLLSVDSDICFY